MELFASKSRLSYQSTRKAESDESHDDSEVTLAQSRVTQSNSSSIEGSFESLGVVDWLCVSAKNMGYRYPTPIQRATIPAILHGRDVIGCAETGMMNKLVKCCT